MMTSLPALHYDADGNCITVQGNALSRLSWNSDLEKRLANQVHDIVNARIISDSFDRNIREEIYSPEVFQAIRDWVVGHAIFLGISSSREKLNKSLSALLPEAGLDMHRFLDEVSKQISIRWNTRQNECRTIVILCSSHGGGNVSVAHAMEEHLVSELKAEVKVIDVQGSLFEASDALYQITGFRETALWNELFVDLDQGEEFSTMKAIVDEAREFVPNNHIGLLKEMIANLHPGLIVSTISGFTRLIQLGELGVPMAIQHTDFCLNAKLYGENPYGTFSSGMLEKIFVLGYLSSSDFRIWLNSDFPDEKSKRLKQHYPPVDLGLIRSLGHPVALSLSDTAPETIRPQVIVMMGNEGRFSSTCEIVETLARQAPELATPIDVSVICGKSVRTYERLLSLQAALPEQIHMEVFQHVPHRKMEELLSKAASVRKNPGIVISKPGGSSVAECAAMKCYMLLVPVFAWEADNARYAIASRMAEMRDEKRTLVEQVNAILARLSPIKHLPIDWKANLVSEIKSIYPLTR